jgi:pimeloyl-ACP methyl ester carboxylesterase
VRVAHQVAGEIPDAALEIVPGVAHMVTLEAPDLFLDRALGFLAAHSLAGAGTR